MSKIAPTGNSYETDKLMWTQAIGSALEKPQRKMILIYCDKRLVGFFMYYVNNDILMMEEIQFKAEHHGKGLFNRLYTFLFAFIPHSVKYAEAYANKENKKSNGILSHLGLVCIGENKNGSSFHYRGLYENMKKVIEDKSKN